MWVYLHVQNVSTVASYFVTAPVNPGQQSHNVDLFDIAKLQVFDVVLQCCVNPLVRMEENEHRWTQHQCVVVFKYNVFDNASTIRLLLQAHTCLASCFFASPIPLPFAITNT